MRQTKSIHVNVKKIKYPRYKFLDLDRKVIEIDFRCIRSTECSAVNYSRRNKQLWSCPEQLQTEVTQYFASCYGPIFNPRTGQPYRNEDGTIRNGQIKPFTLSGLALSCNISLKVLHSVADGSWDDLGYRADSEYQQVQFSEIMNKARMRVQEFAEARLYDKDGFNGGRYVLDYAFGWGYRKDKTDAKVAQERLNLAKKEFELKKTILQGRDAAEPLNITITRAGE